MISSVLDFWLVAHPKYAGRSEHVLHFKLTQVYIIFNLDNIEYASKYTYIHKITKTND